MESSRVNVKLEKVLLNCPICFDQYDSKPKLSRTPKMLPLCGHTLCNTCLRNIIKGHGNAAQCPIDRTNLLNSNLNLSEDDNIENFFQNNMLVINILDQINSQKRTIEPKSDKIDAKQKKASQSVANEDGGNNVEERKEEIALDENGQPIDPAEQEKIDLAESKKFATIDEPEKIEEKVECKNEDTGIEINKNDLKYLLADKTWKQCLQNFPDADKLIDNLVDLGFVKPSKIQSKTIPFAMTGRNVGILVQSHNGSGKTLGFAIPAILRVDPAKPLYQNDNQTLYYPQVVILAPTIELSTQIVKVIRMIAKPFQNIQVSLGKVAAHIVVRTPKSLLKLMADKNVDLSNVALCVVDEADELLQGESGQSLLGLIKKIPKEVSSLYFFSATYTEESVSYINSFFKMLQINLVLRHMLKAEELKIVGIQEFNKRLDPKKKASYIGHLLDNLFEIDIQIIIFAHTKSFAETIFRALQKRNHSVNLLTGGQRPSERNDIFNAFKKGKFKTLVTTNLLARVLNQKSIGLVINVDIPRHYGETANKPDFETYLHRIKNVTIFGNVGLALDLYTRDEEKNMLTKILNNYQIQSKDLSNFDDGVEFEMIHRSLRKVLEVNEAKRKELEGYIRSVGKIKGK